VNPESFTVLVVCTGNLNRSALGAALLRTWAGWYLPGPLAAQVVVASAGLAAPVGSQMRSRTRTIVEALGADGSGHRAAQVTEDVVRGADLVLVAEAGQRDMVLGFAPGALKHTFTIREAGAIAGELPEWDPPATLDDLRDRVAQFGAHRELANGSPTDIVDPQGRDSDAYRTMAREAVPALARLASALFGMPAREVVAYDDAVADGTILPVDDDTPDHVAGLGRPRGRRRA
jgi:protein-tyrosine phosphatase